MADETLAHTARKNRTVICTVLFADIIGFSQRSVGDQKVIKEHFNEIMGQAVKNIAAVDRMVIDSGDGLALCLFGDPEEGMFTALAIRDGFAQERPLNVPGYDVRIGINLGPIKVVTDLNDRFNAIGDGINVAQRVMNFAQPGQVLCSRSYFEIVSRLSDDFARLFEYCGIRHDKHVREHDVYEVRSPMAPGSSGFEMPESEVVPISPKPEIGSETREKLAILLAKFEGPMAKVLVRQACEAASSPEEAVQRIAKEMSNPTEAAEFVRLSKNCFVI